MIKKVILLSVALSSAAYALLKLHKYRKVTNPARNRTAYLLPQLSDSAIYASGNYRDPLNKWE